MYQRILVPTDGSELSDHAVQRATELARATGGVVTLFYAEADPLAAYAGAAVVGAAGYSQDVQERFDEAAAHSLDRAEQIVTAAGVRCQRRLGSGGTPWQLIVRVADEIDADLIVMAMHARTPVGRLLLGSQTEQVLKHCRRPVLVTH